MAVGILAPPAGQPDVASATKPALGSVRAPVPDLAALRGTVTVVNFWGSWCAPCRAEAADLEQTYQTTRSAGVQFVGVNVKDQPGPALASSASRG